MKAEVITLHPERNVTLTAYLHEQGNSFQHITRRPAVLVLPGGGYSMCSDGEADPVALGYLEAGYQAFVLRYSVGEHAAWPTPLQDYEETMTMIRAHAETWNLYPDKIAVVGFSAGGHLAGAAATLAVNRPNAAILGYPVTEGETARMCLATAPDLVSAVDATTCPCFVFATRTDNIVPVSNTLNFTQALADAGISFESHIYAYGPHGFSACNSSVLAPGTRIASRARHWMRDSIEWLSDLFGDFGDGEMMEPRISGRVNEDRAPFLSVDCTMDRLMSNAAARAILEPMMAAAQERMAERYGDKMNIANDGTGVGQSLGGKMTLRSALSYGNVPEEMVNQLNAALQKILNE